MHERVNNKRYCVALVIVLTLVTRAHGQRLVRLPPVTDAQMGEIFEIRDLQQQIQQLEASIAAIEPPSVAQSTNRGLPIAQPIQLANFTDAILNESMMDIGGYVKLDLIHDFNAIDSTDSFDPLTIPTDGRLGQNTRLHARQTRLNLDFRPHEDCDELRLFIEGDFFGTRDTFRLRHAYIRAGRLLAGQTWSTFMDESILPRTLDFESARSVVLDRRGLLRWTNPVTDSLAMAVAVEDPQPLLDLDSAPPGDAERAAPDLIGRVRYDAVSWHLQAAGVARLLRFRQTTGGSDDVVGWGFNFTGRVNPNDFDSVLFQVAFGDGIESYRGATDAAVDVNGEFEVIPVIAWVVGYEIDWTDQCSSAFVYSSGSGTNAAFQSPNAAQAADYLAANIIVAPLPRLSWGVEYLYGTRTDKDNAKGEAHRVQFSVRYDLP